MPLYEYVCPDCGTKFERLRRFGQDDGLPCPDCGADSERVFSVFSSIRKDSGGAMESAMSGAAAGGHGGHQPGWA